MPSLRTNTLGPLIPTVLHGLIPGIQGAINFTIKGKVPVTGLFNQAVVRLLMIEYRLSNIHIPGHPTLFTDLNRWINLFIPGIHKVLTAFMRLPLQDQALDEE
jgi:hypothetical protein